MNNNPYVLSTDYLTLFEKLTVGDIVVAFVNFSFSGSEVVFRDVCQMKMTKGEISGFARGVNYLTISEFDVRLFNQNNPDTPVDLQGLFLLSCKNMEVGWIPSLSD